MPPEALSAHAAVKNELLVRYLDAWLPAALHGHKRVTYVDTSADSVAAAARVIGEFADLLHRHTVTLLAPADELTAAGVADPPPGLVLAPCAGQLVTGLREARALGSPIFAWLDAPVPLDLLSTVAKSKGSEMTLSGADATTAALVRRSGLPLTVDVELVNGTGTADRMVFATSSERSLEKFKDELWALDEYAGIRLRDPTDPDATLLDISVQPQLGPLRRAVGVRLTETGGSTLAELRTWAVNQTIYRAADVTRAVQALIVSGTVSRTPIGGRLSPDTLVQPVASTELTDVDVNE